MEPALQPLLDHCAEFLAYLRKQGATNEQAEDILQSALARGLEPWTAPPDPKSIIPWFYRVLRNAFIDQARRSSAADRALERYSREPVNEVSTEAKRICTCTRRALASLKPEYAELIERVDVRGLSVEEAAAQAGITTNNAHVRLHRARRALRERLEAVCGGCAVGDSRCSDCYCQPDESV